MMKKLTISLLLVIASNQSVFTTPASDLPHSITISGSVWKGQLSDTAQQLINDTIDNNKINALQVTPNLNGGAYVVEGVQLSESDGAYIQNGKYYADSSATGVDYLVHVGLQTLLQGDTIQPSNYQESGKYLHIKMMDGATVNSIFELTGTVYDNCIAYGNDIYFKIYIAS